MWAFFAAASVAQQKAWQETVDMWDLLGMKPSGEAQFSSVLLSTLTWQWGWQTRKSVELSTQPFLTTSLLARVF